MAHDGSVTAAREALIEQLREHALVIGKVILTSGRTAEYLVDAKRAILRPEGFFALASLVADQAGTWQATAVGGMTMGADPIACAALAGGARRQGILRAQGRQGPRPRAPDRGAAPCAGGPANGGRRRGDDWGLDHPGGGGGARGGPHRMRRPGDMRPVGRRLRGNRAGRGGPICGSNDDRRDLSATSGPRVGRGGRRSLRLALVAARTVRVGSSGG